MSAVVSQPASNQPVCPCCGATVSPLEMLLDEQRGIIAFGGEVARLTPRQFVLFRTLVEAYPRVLDKPTLLRAISDPESADGGPEPKIIDVMVCKIRAVLDPLGLVIVTQWGTGYSIELNDAGKAIFLRDRRFNETRNMKSAPDSGDMATVAMLRSQGYPLTEIARRAKLTYRGVMRAIENIEAAAQHKRSRGGVA